MNLHDFSNYGILGSNVNGFVLSDSVISGTNGNTNSGSNIESSVAFQQLIGTSGFLNNDISGGAARNINIDNQSGTLNLTATGNNIHNTSAGGITGDDGFAIEAETTATVLANISNNTFSAHAGDDFNLSLINSAVVDLTFNNNNLSGGNPAKLGGGVFILGATFNGSLEYDISNNTVLGANQGGAIFVNKGSGTATFSGQIVDNVVGNPAVNHSGALQSVGIHASARGAGGLHTTLIHSNEVYQYHDRGIVLEAGEGSPTFVATVTSNTVSNFADAVNSLHGIHFDFGILSGDNAQITIDVRNNLIANAGNEAQGGVDFRMRTAGSNDTFIAGYSGGNSAANAQTFIDGQNPDGTIFSVSQVASGTYNNGPAVPLPTPNLPELPTAPVLSISPNGNHIFAQNQVEINSVVFAQVASEIDPANTVVTASANVGSGKSLFRIGQPAPTYAPLDPDPIVIGTLPAGKSVTIKFQVTVNGPSLPSGTTKITTQGTVQSNELADMFTTNGGTVNCETGSETCTPVDRPDTTVTSTNRSTSSPTNAASVSWTVTFADAISGLTSSNFALVNGGLGGTPAITAVTPVGGAPATQWTVTASAGTGDGTLGLNLTNDTSLSHDMTNLTFTGQVYTIERTPPTVTNVTSSTANGFYNASDVISIQVVFSEAVNVTGTPQSTLETGAIDEVVNYTSGSGTNTLTFTYTVQAGDTSPDLDYTGTSSLSLNGGTIQDAAQNDATLTCPRRAQPVP